VELIAAKLASIAADWQWRPATWKRPSNYLASLFREPGIVFREAKTLRRDPGIARRVDRTSRRGDKACCCAAVTCFCVD
jgi:hypothetical protein